MHRFAPPVHQSPSLGVSNCYVFKSRLQEYAQKVGFSTPVYETIKEGPSHEPHFKSTVIVNNARYDSLPGFSNRKAAEQSAAEVALIELANCEDNKNAICQPVHEIGLCKNMLQEYAQKMNYAIPSYECKREDKAGRGHYSCVVDIGGIRYVGAVAKTKKEAEIKAARTALLAIQTSPSQIEEVPNEETQYTVVPCKRKEPESITPKQESVKTRKTKRSRLKKKPFNKKRRVGDDNVIQAGCVGAVGTNLCTGAINVSSVDTNLGVEVTTVPSGSLCTDEIMPHEGTLNMSPSYGDSSSYDNIAIQAGRVDVVNTNLGTELINVPSVDTNLDTETITIPFGNLYRDETMPHDGMLNMSPSYGDSLSYDDNAIQVGRVDAVNTNLDTEVVIYVSSVDTNLGAEATTVPSSNLSTDEIMPHDGALNIRQSFGDKSTSEVVTDLL